MHLQPARPRHAVQALLLAALCAASTTFAADTTPAEQLGRWSTQAARPGNAVQGKQFFATRHDGEWSCASCHGAVPTTAGQHAATGKDIAPLAPTFNPKALTDTARTDKWFRRNCADVLRRECSPGEKADVLAYLLSLQR